VIHRRSKLLRAWRGLPDARQLYKAYLYIEFHSFDITRLLAEGKFAEEGNVVRAVPSWKIGNLKFNRPFLIERALQLSRARSTVVLLDNLD